jgi:hypothetical protein
MKQEFSSKKEKKKKRRPILLKKIINIKLNETFLINGVLNVLDQLGRHSCIT